MSSSFKYLVYDIESVINKQLLNKVLYPGEGLTDEAAYQKHVAELLAKDPDRTFINPSFHRPVTIAAMAVKEDYSIAKINLLGEVPRTTRKIVEHFWQIYNDHRPCLVDFFGRGYDLRLMELWAYQLGLAIHRDHFKQFGTRYRFSEKDHIDLQDFLTNYGAVRLKGLDLFAKLLGKPGKMETSGDQVQALFEAGEQFKIDDYCLSDVMDTYFVFLRTRVMMGDLTLEKEHALVAAAKKVMEEKREKEGYFKNYLDNFGEWVRED